MVVIGRRSDEASPAPLVLDGPIGSTAPDGPIGSAAPGRPRVPTASRPPSARPAGPSPPHDRGSVTAELAVALPAVVTIVALLVWGLQLAAVQVRLQDAAAISARALARGDGLPRQVLAAAAADTNAASRRDGDLVCVEVSAHASGPVGFGLPLAADSCALDAGR